MKIYIRNYSPFKVVKINFFLVLILILINNNQIFSIPYKIPFEKMNQKYTKLYKNIVYNNNDDISMSILSENPLVREHKVERHTILGIKLGLTVSGFNCGLQCYLFKPQFGIILVYQITKNIGILIDLNIWHQMGSKDIQISLPLGLKNLDKTKKNINSNQKDASSDENTSEYDDEDSSSTVGNIVNKVQEFGKEVVVLKEPEYFNLTYLTIPISFCYIFKSNKDSYITNYISLGMQVGILYKASVRRYKFDSITLKENENIAEKWANPLEYDTLDIIDKVQKYEIGLIFSYMFKTKDNCIFGIKYYEGLSKIFKIDRNSFDQQRRHIGLEIFFCYDLMNLFV